ncbi:hypothetical protein [Protofrankia symbiont of Coriaria ruscifolia]|uniref:hypothetical protein n=1 Tax=Protofrankia symbiont of Coriaria ruscifolia TaxID=1306542 RepID=UPI0010411EC8|nr:hypothetical protein [Protofrankia symbiont of Coriaria ruscifolia]
MGRRRDAGPVAGPAVAAWSQALPDPYEAIGDSPNLIDTERQDLALAEAAIDSLRVAFWAAGKALQLIRDARLYRGTHDTFESYVEDRWDMQRAHAYRLIQAWPLAERLSPMGDKLNERQVRGLLPVASRHGQDAAVDVYQVVAETEGVRVTAGVLDDVIRILPAGEWDRDQAVRQIRAYLAGQVQQPAADAAPVTTWEAEAARLRDTVRRIVTRPAWRTAAREHPDQARAVIAELRELLDEVEKSAAGDL